MFFTFFLVSCNNNTSEKLIIVNNQPTIDNIKEEIIRGDLSFILSNIKDREIIKGEIVIVLEPLDLSEKFEISENIKVQIQSLLQNNSLRDVVDTIVAQTGKSRNVIYKYSLSEKNKLKKL